MEINETDYILGYWFADDGKDRNWYMMIVKRDNQWLGQQTFRHNKNNGDPFLGEDEKSIYDLTVDGDKPEQEVIDIINKVFEVIKTRYNYLYDSWLVQGGFDKFMEIAKTKDYLHFKTAH